MHRAALLRTTTGPTTPVFRKSLISPYEQTLCKSKAAIHFAKIFEQYLQIILLIYLCITYSILT